MKSSSMTAVGPTGSMGFSPRPSLPTIWRAERRSAQPRNKSFQETRRASPTKIRMGVGTTNSRRAMIDPRPTSRAEGSLNRTSAAIRVAEIGCPGGDSSLRTGASKLARTYAKILIFCAYNSTWFRRSRSADSQCQDPMQQLGISNAVMQGRRGELLGASDLGIGVGLDVVGDAVGRESEIDARVTVELERAVNSLGGSFDAGAQLRREILGRPVQDAAALLILGVVLDPFRGDESCAMCHASELELPDRQDAEPIVPEHADIELPALDVLLGNGRGADPFVDEADTLGKLLVGLHHRRLRDAVGGILVQALDDERQSQARRTPDLAPHREDGECRQRDAVIGQQLLGQILAARQHEPARIAAGIGNAQQLEIAGDVLVVDGLAVELLEQIEDDVRFPALDFVADRLELVLDAARPHLVAGLAQRAHDVILGLPPVDFLLAAALDRVRRNQVRMQEHQNEKPLHSASQRRGGL